MKRPRHAPAASLRLRDGEAGLARMAPETDLLGRTLDADVSLRPGAPQEGAQAAPGQFVDRKS